MLDPFTALSLAGNVVQFVQFGCHLAAKAHEIHSSTSGASEDGLEMEAVTARLLETVQDLDDQQIGRDALKLRDRDSPKERRLMEIADACRMIAADILRRLEVLKQHKPPSVWNSISQAFKCIWTEDELMALTRRLKAYISELDTAILVSLKRNIDLANIRASENFYKLGEASQRIVDLLLLNRSVFTTEIRAQTKEIQGIIVSEQAQTRALIMDLVQQKGIKQATSASYFQLSSSMGDAASTESTCAGGSIGKLLLDSLGFSAMQNRQDEVAQAYHSTFEWIFQKSREEEEAIRWTNFADWLQHGDGIYWINGKAGSGKSTLMKYVYNDLRTSQLLSIWSGSTPVLVASFFFWNGGSRDQRSQTGLLRSLLFQILQHQPSLIDQVFPDEVAQLQSVSASALRDHPRQCWSLQRLQDAVQRLLRMSILPMKVCLFIDGLDEFEGEEDEDDRNYMIRLFKSLASSPFIKICLSSRPLVIFEEAFRKTPGLRLQDLTSGDIRRFVTDKLSRDPKMRLITVNEPLHNHGLIEEISGKAQGVFLWVKLVVRSLLDGLSNGDNLKDLRARLDLLPQDLEDLYRHMITHIEPLYLKRASQVFQIIQTAREVQSIHRRDGLRTTPVTVLLLALAVEENADLGIISDPEYWTTARLSALCDTMRRRLQTWCAGLIEVPNFIWNRVERMNSNRALKTKITWEIAYLHRTARDFLETKFIWSMLLYHTTNTEFEPCTSLLRSTVLLYKIASPLVANPLGHGLFRNELLEPVTDALYFAQRAEATTKKGQLATLEELDSLMRVHLIRWTGKYLGHWSQFFNIEGLKGSFPSFMDVAVVFNLQNYVLEKVASDYVQYLAEFQKKEDYAWVHQYFRQPPSDPDDSGQWPISSLDLAVRPGAQGSDMARILFENGADPNEVSGPGSTWEQVLGRASIASKKGIYGEKWLQIIKLFIQYNVDLRRGRDLADARQHVLDVVQKFEKEHPGKVVQLQAMIEKRLPKSKRRQLKLWANGKLGSQKPIA